MPNIVDGLRSEFDTLWRETLSVLDDSSCPPLAWRPGGSGRINPVAVLVTHLCGADTFWVGDLVGGRSSGRVRRAEFDPEVTESATTASLMSLVERTRSVVDETLASLTDETLTLPVSRGGGDGQSPATDCTAATSHPLLQRDEPVTRLYCVLHALTHHSHHNGQLLVLRRLWQEEQRR